MNVVETEEDILANLDELHRYTDRFREPQLRFFNERISRGACFVHCMINGESFFGPSRFLGYKNNDWRIQQTNKDKDGGETNEAISKVLGSDPVPNDAKEAKFAEFCSNFAVDYNARSKRPRKFWRNVLELTPANAGAELVESPDDYDIEAEIFSNRALDSTVRQQVILARVGQGRFRANVARVEQFCRISGIDDQRFLRASHIKPWSKCGSVEERLNGHNGLFLSPEFDHLFDAGFISFKNDGTIILSERLPEDIAGRFKVPKQQHQSAKPFTLLQKQFMAYHREHVFQATSLSVLHLPFLA